MSASYLTFHRAPERHAHFTSPDVHAPFLDPVTKAWIITEPDCCERLLSSPDARPATYSDDYVLLQERFGIDFSNVLFAFSQVPLCLHDEPHRHARRRFAGFLTARKSDIAHSIAKGVEAHLAILRQEGEVEIMRQVFTPLVLRVAGRSRRYRPGCRRRVPISLDGVRQVNRRS